MTDLSTISVSQPTLIDVVRGIPESCYRRSTTRGLFYVVRDFLIYAVLLGALITVDSWWALPVLWLITGVSISGIFVLGHDASHNALFNSKRLNSFVAKFAFLPSAHVESAWDFGHNRVHHGHTVKQGMDFVWHPATADEWNAMGASAQLRHRLEWSWLGAGLYYGRNVWWNKMMRFSTEGKLGGTIARERRSMSMLLLLAAAAVGYAGWLTHGDVVGITWMIVKVAVVPWLLFTWMIGFVVYVQHINRDIRWYPRREWSKFRGQMEGTTNLRIPRLLNLFLHNIFIHVPHHVDMRIPFYRLPQAMNSIEAGFPGVAITKKLRMRDYFTTTSGCKLYDFESGAWSRYPTKQKAA
jgi:omega-6 fatty acid desaturase (delta-12 desaturase)